MKNIWSRDTDAIKSTCGENVVGNVGIQVGTSDTCVGVNEDGIVVGID